MQHMSRFDEIILDRVFCRKDADTPAFCIRGECFSYRRFISLASNMAVRFESLDREMICLYATDDVRTYAAIFALWMCGKAYVPLNPVQPKGRHLEVMESIGATCVISADRSYTVDDPSVSVIDVSGLESVAGQEVVPFRHDVPEDKAAYVIFTSGSTGKPKGVVITRGNLAAFVDSTGHTGLSISGEDRCLQPFDLTFDFSVSSYLLPLLNGACVYTIPPKAIKFLQIAALVEKYRLTVLQMVPSMARNLLPYASELDLGSVKYNIFCGDALTRQIVKGWHKLNPDMVSYNMYGPTEGTVFCAGYVMNERNLDSLETYNDVVSIGKPYANCQVAIIGDDGEVITSVGEKGELCLAGAQLTPGYWNNPQENSSRFFMLDGVRFYGSGDICFYGEDGNLAYVGRKDFQVKINGFRVELLEVEKCFSDASGGMFSVAMPTTNSQGNTELVLAVEGRERDCTSEKAYLAAHLPKYEVPSRFIFVRSIPMNVNGKVDRKALAAMMDI